MKWMNLLLFLFLFLLLRMHFIAKVKGIELCHFPWALVNTFVTQDDILTSDWCLPSSSFLLSCWFIFCFFTFFSYTKYHKSVWFIYRWRNFFQNSTLFFAIFPFDSCDVSDHKLWPKVEFIILVDAMIKGLVSPPAKRFKS